MGNARMPSAFAIERGFRLARWELERQLDAIDHALRNARLDDTYEELAAHFLWRWLTEWMLELKERAGPRIQRAHLVAALDQAEARVRGRLKN
jgi:hypothetical protein